MDQQREAAEASLSSREKEVLHLIAASSTDREVAERLNISPHTASTHRRNLMRKLEVTNVADLVRSAVTLGLVPLKGEDPSMPD
jgi:DNA-binding CsgD family transcriptional regulator